MDSFDVKKNRDQQKWTRSEQARRVIWGLLTPLFRFSPRPLWGWRRGLLRIMGARIGADVHVYPTVRITIPWNISIGDQSAVGDRAILYALGPIQIGERVTVSQGAHICAGTHDLSQPHRPLVKPPIAIGDEAWICADAFIGPSVSIGTKSIVGARAVVVVDVQNGTRVAGNPARVISSSKGSNQS